MLRYILFSSLFSFICFAQVDKNLYRPINDYSHESNISYLIKTLTKDYKPIFKMLAPQITAKQLQAELNLKLSTKQSLSKNTSKSITQWFQANPRIEDYYAIYELKRCQINNYAKQEVIFDMDKFLELQKDFLTYFQYSIISNLLSKKDIMDESLRFIQFMNFTIRECDHRLDQNLGFIQLYKDLIERLLIPLTKLKRITSEEAIKLLNEIDSIAVTSFDKSISQTYSSIINELKDLKKEEKKILVPVLNKNINTLLQLARKNFPKKEIGAFLKSLKKDYKSNQYLLRKLNALSFEKLRLIVHQFNYQIISLQFTTYKKAFPKKKDFNPATIKSKRIINPETVKPYKIKISKGEILLANPTYSSIQE